MQRGTEALSTRIQQTFTDLGDPFVNIDHLTQTVRQIEEYAREHHIDPAEYETLGGYFTAIKEKLEQQLRVMGNYMTPEPEAEEELNTDLVIISMFARIMGPVLWDVEAT